MTLSQTITHEQIRELILRVTTLHNDLVNVGLTQTGNKMHEVVRQIGWEVEKVITGEHGLSKLVCPHGFEDFDLCADCGH